MDGWIILAGGWLLGALCVLGWSRSASAPEDPAVTYAQGYGIGWHDALAAMRRACGEETTGPYRLADVIAEANRRMRP